MGIRRKSASSGTIFNKVGLKYVSVPNFIKVICGLKTNLHGQKDKHVYRFNKSWIYLKRFYVRPHKITIPCTTSGVGYRYWVEESLANWLSLYVSYIQIFLVIKNLIPFSRFIMYIYLLLKCIYFYFSSALVINLPVK